MTNTALRRNDRAFAGLAVDLAKNPKELPTRDLRARTASPTTTTPSMSSKATATNAVEIGRWQSRTSRCVTDTVRARFPAQIRGAAIRDFEEVRQAADFPIAKPPSCSDPFAAQMQIPAGFSRQGSAEKLTDGEWHYPVARQGPALQLKSTPQFHARLFCGQKTSSAYATPHTRRAPKA